MEHSNLCPKFEKAMEILSKRWTGLILFELLAGCKRFSDLEHALPISGRLLSERLKELEKEAIVQRIVYPETPVRIEYVLTQKGKELQPFIQDIQQWASKWIKAEKMK